MCVKKRNKSDHDNKCNNVKECYKKNKKRHEKRLRYSYKRVAATIKRPKKTDRTQMCHLRIIELRLFCFMSRPNKRKLCSGQHASCSRVFLTSY